MPFWRRKSHAVCAMLKKTKDMQVELLGLTWEMGCCKADWAMHEVAIGLANEPNFVAYLGLTLD